MTSDTHAQKEIVAMRRQWKKEEKDGIIRPYTPEQVYALRGSIHREHSLAQRGGKKLRKLLKEHDFLRSFGVINGAQAVQAVRGGMPVLYVSGWQTAYAANRQGMLPDMSLHSVEAVPDVIRSIQHGLLRQDQLQHSKFCNGAIGKSEMVDWETPIIADLDSGYGTFLNAFELALKCIEAGVSGLHIEDQGGIKKCGHLGGKVVVPTVEHILRLVAVRLAADVANVPTVVIARTDANSASLISSDMDERDTPFIETNRERTFPEGYWHFRGGRNATISRLKAFAPYADLLWAETSTPDVEEYEDFAQAVHEVHPSKMFAYNNSPSFKGWAQNSNTTNEVFQEELAARAGVRWHFITLAGTHLINLATYEFARDYTRRGMAAYGDLQRKEIMAEQDGYGFLKHQTEAGTPVFDEIINTVTGGKSSLGGMKGSTEDEQF